MSNNKPPPSSHEAGVSDNSQSQGHPAPPPFNPIQASHSAPNANHVHSVVPDLMRVYESLTNGNPTVHKDQHPQSPQKPKQQDIEANYNPATEGPGHPQAQHVNYAYITSEEQYRQVYQHQSGDTASSDLVSQHHFQGPNSASLPYIPVPYDATTSRVSANTQPPQEGLKASNTEETSSQSSSRAPMRRKRSITSQQQEQEPSASSGTGKSKSRKKAKETDGRWSKRFTWPDELHRDFVSAVFDVGLKHSSPSTILEHMPKHPQITSERIKSHLQKYRVHRTKSKQEFMSSYEMSLKKFKNGDMEEVKSLTDGEVAAHLSHTVLTDGAGPGSGASAGASARASAQAASQDGEGQPRQPQSSQSGDQGTPQPQRLGPPPPGHEALMLPKLTEAEKSSPIGASMGYLLGLFFSLKKQLLIQRNLSSSDTKPVLVPGLQPSPFDMSAGVVAGPVAAVYTSFTGTNMPPADAIGNPGARVSNPTHQPIETHPIATAASMDWSSGSNGGPGNAGREPATGMAAAAAAAAPASNPAMQSLNNLEASSMMKREMQNQMAFQNKMRALKQQELNKYKNVEPNHNSAAPQMEANHHHSVVRFKHEEPSAVAAFTDGNLQHHQGGAKKDHSDMVTALAPHEENIHQEAHHHHQHAPMTTQMHHHHHQDHQGGEGGEIKEDEGHNNTGAPGDAQAQGAGEAAAARGRAPSFSMGGNDDFWTADVMDEQLFEFLMNN